MIVTKRESMAFLIHDTSPTLRHSLQQSHNKGLYYGFRDAILSRLVTIIKCLVHHAVYCISLSCLLSFLCNPYIPFLINPRHACAARVTVVVLCVCLSVCSSASILALQATRRLMSDTSSFSATRAGKITWQFC